jgi:hypothetical protein
MQRISACYKWQTVCLTSSLEQEAMNFCKLYLLYMTNKVMIEVSLFILKTIY